MVGSGTVGMILMSELRDIPDELANRMMVSHGSTELLRALRGEPELPEETTPLPQGPRVRNKYARPYVQLAKRVRSEPPTSVARVIAVVAEASGLSVPELTGKARQMPHVRARALAYRLLRDRVGREGGPRYSLPQIADWFGREHSVVSHALDMFPIYAKQSPAYAALYTSLREPAE